MKRLLQQRHDHSMDLEAKHILAELVLVAEVGQYSKQHAGRSVGK
jgi:plasmid stability protein